MKELQELRNEILTLRNYGVINKEEENSLLTKLKSVKEQFAICGVVLSNRYKTEEFSIYTPKDDECVVVIEDSFKHKRTFDVDDFNKLMSVLHSVQDY